jgi:hypothetical protein
VACCFGRPSYRARGFLCHGVLHVMAVLPLASRVHCLRYLRFAYIAIRGLLVIHLSFLFLFTAVFCVGARSSYTIPAGGRGKLEPPVRALSPSLRPSLGWLGGVSGVSSLSALVWRADCY